MRVKILLLVCTLTIAKVVVAEEFNSAVRPYDSIQAGLDAHAVGEARRLDAIDRQIGWNQLFRAQAAAQASSSFYFNPSIGEFDYAYGLNAGHGGWFPSALDYRPIWGYGYYEAVRQPIGQRQVQTGPNRWESFPIYGNEDGPAVVDTVMQPVIEPTPVDAVPLQPIAPRPPAAPTPRGREF